jgi:hypothetical protein
MTDLATIAYRVSSISAPSRAILRYRDALLHAVAMQALPKDAEDREERQRNTRAAALRRLRRLDEGDLERVRVADGVIE